MKSSHLRFLYPAVAAGVTAATLAVPSSADPGDANAVPPALLNTHCTVDQLLGATKVEDPPTYYALVDRYNSEPPWLQQAILTHMNDLLAKDPAGRQGEVDELGILFPQFAGLLRTQEPRANSVAADCPNLPARDPSLLAPQS